MLLTIDIEHKTMGNKLLFRGLQLHVDAKEKIAIIGRNGIGKTTLFRMLTGEDTEYDGHITWRSGTRIVATQQEHHDLGAATVVEYILNNLPDYKQLKHIIDTYPETMGDHMRKIREYSDALEQFGDADYYTVEDRVRRSLDEYQLGAQADRPMASLSGGQKRFVELIRVEHSRADIALIDEPTNHMDYVAKAAFIKWFENVPHAVIVVTHDRDVLQKAARIVDIKDYQASVFPGNYDAYLAQNATRVATDLNDYDTMQRRIVNIKKQIQAARAKKSQWGGTADKKNPFVVIETKLLKELKELESVERPSFWIDQESVAGLRPNVEASYQKHKAKTIHIRRLDSAERQRELITLDDVQAGYGDKPLFTPVNIRLQTGDRLQLVGRNGAGKTTLIKTILDSLQVPRPSTLLHGKIVLDSKLRIATYEQEVQAGLLDQTLGEAVETIYDRLGVPVNAEVVMRVLSDYLFEPYADREQLVRNLSGGQKARLQLIKLFAANPNCIILDEPTNHLDLPSIEELEAALQQYRGAIMYVSHDSYFTQHLGGATLAITPA